MKIGRGVVCRLTGEDSPELFRGIASLHSELIHGGVLPLLGINFLAGLYQEIAKSKWGSVHVVLEQGKVIGFLAGTPNLWRCLSGFSFFGYLRLTMHLMMSAWRPPVLLKVIDSLAYPFRKPAASECNAVQDAASQDKNRAELLAIAVSQAAQGMGVGRGLVCAFESTLLGKVDQYFVTTNTKEIQSNAFYSKLGFTKAGQKRHHDLLIQIYTKRIEVMPEQVI